MTKRSARERLLDIVQAIEKIERFLTDQNFEVFRTNALIHDAVVRTLRSCRKRAAMFHLRSKLNTSYLLARNRRLRKYSSARL